MMRALELDFRRRPRPSVAGWLLLASGLAALGAAIWEDRGIAADTALHEADVRRIERSLPEAARLQAAPAKQSKERDTALADMRRVQARLKLPWDDFFTTLESVAGADIALLSLSPDARKRQVRIAGEARDLGAMLAFHRRLEDSAALRDVSLINHEIEEQAQGRPVRFSLVANWVIDDARP